MRYTLIVCLALFSLLGCTNKPVETQNAKTAINRVLDDWHHAAAESDFKRYFSHFAGDSAIFMGTDKDEYWTVPEFKDYARKPFKNNSGWEFIPFNRHIYISETGQVAWFDESLKSVSFGLARGSGVLVKADTTWKIAHYNLSMPVPNAIVYDVVDQIEAFKKTSKKSKE